MLNRYDWRALACIVFAALFSAVMFWMFAATGNAIWLAVGLGEAFPTLVIGSALVGDWVRAYRLARRAGRPMATFRSPEFQSDN